MENNIDVLIYTEGGFRLGLGNIYRSISLAKALKKKGKKKIEIITSSDKYVLDIIHKNNLPSLFFEKKRILKEIISFNPDILIIDFLNLDKKFVKKIKESTHSKIVIIGNDTSANRYADMVVNAIVGTRFKNSTHYLNSTLYLEGPKYLVLREEFVKKRNRYVYKGKLRDILLLFGGTDQANFTCKVFKDLLDYNRKFKLTLVIGAGFKYENELIKLMKEYIDVKVKLFRNISNVSSIMLKNDFVITSAGTALFEGFCVGVPTVGLFQNPSQSKVFRDFFMTKKYEDIENIGKFIETIYTDVDKYRSGRGLIQAGEGKEDIVEHIIKL